MNVEVVAAPDQNIVGSDRAAVGLPAAFNVTLDGLKGASVISHRWTFSDGATVQGAEVTHTFAEPGDFLATVTTDMAGGNTGCAMLEIRRKVLVNAAPTANIAGPDKIATGAAAVFDGSASFDPNGALTGFAWGFGGGTNRHRRRCCPYLWHARHLKLAFARYRRRRR